MCFLYGALFSFFVRNMRKMTPSKNINIPQTYKMENIDIKSKCIITFDDNVHLFLYYEERHMCHISIQHKPITSINIRKIWDYDIDFFIHSNRKHLIGRLYRCISIRAHWYWNFDLECLHSRFYFRWPWYAQ